MMRIPRKRFTRRPPFGEALESRRLLSNLPFIAEFQAVNDATLADEDGHFSDWIEVRNPNDEDVDLSGWYLTDDQLKLTKWQFPAVRVPAKSELVIFASDKDRRISPGTLHTNFRLTGRGEYLALVKPDGRTVAHSFAPYPPQIADTSYGVTEGYRVQSLVDHGAAVKTWVPSDDSLNDRWTHVDFDDRAWAKGVSPVGYERSLPARLDLMEFQDPIEPSWTVDIPPDGSSTLGARDGQLEIDLPARQNRPSSTNRGKAPYVYRPAPQDAISYEFTARIELPSSASAGVMIFDGSEGRPVLTVEYRGRSTFRFQSSDGRPIGSVRDAGNQVSWLRLQRNGGNNTWTGSYKTSRDHEWTLIGTITDDSPRMVPILDPQVGLVAHTTSSSAVVRLSEFTLSTPASPPVYGPLIKHDLESTMQDVNSSVYLRYPFQLDRPPSQLSDLGMALTFDDGFHAYLNGTRIATRNAAQKVAWDSSAEAPAGAVLDEVPIDIINLRSSLPLLEQGTNVFAVHLLNHSSSDRDILFAPSLAATQSIPDTIATFHEPTPGLPNRPTAAPAPTVIGEQGVFFGTTSVELTLENATPSVQIFYTLDGSAPTPNSARYLGPITLNRSVMLQARSFDLAADNPLQPSRTISGTYIAAAPELEDNTWNVPIIILDTLSNGVPQSSDKDLVPVNVASFGLSDTNQRSSLSLPNVEYVGRGGIRDRGSSTRSQPKLNLAFELWGPNGTNADDDYDAVIGGLPPESDWVLYAPFIYDRAMVRNQFMFQLARSVLPWAPRTQPVELYLNRSGEAVEAADYMGTYVLMEKIKRGDQRLDISRTTSEQNDPTSEDVTGGYIWKIDRPDPGDPGLHAGGRVIQWVYPKASINGADAANQVTDTQQQWVTEYFNALAETLVTPDFHDPNGYTKFIDVDSWIDNHLINVLTFNVDALRLSAYFFKDRNSKLEYGPPWDCDRCMESTDPRDDQPDAWYDPGGTDFFTNDTYDDIWFQQLFKDPQFWQAYVDRWSELRQTLWSDQQLSEMLDHIAAPIQESAVRNFSKWPLIPPRTNSLYPSGELDGTWEGEIEHLRKWLVQRAAFMDFNLSSGPSLMVDRIAVTPNNAFELHGGQSVSLANFSQSNIDHPLTLDQTEASVRFHVPGDDRLGNRWTTLEFDDSAWREGTYGLGYDDGEDFTGIINTRVAPHELEDGASNLFARSAFYISDLNAHQNGDLILRIKYDDGFEAFLNGKRVARHQLRDPAPNWESEATPRRDPEAVEFQEFNISRHRDILVEGTNVLAIRVVNAASGGGDLLLVPELLRRVSTTSTQSQHTIYYTTDGTDPRGIDGQPSTTAEATTSGDRLVLSRDSRITIKARTFAPHQRGPESSFILTDWSAPASFEVVFSDDPVEGDFDQDGRLTANDIDLLFSAARHPIADPKFDLNQDQRVNELDRDDLITKHFKTNFGDANLDGVFDERDLVHLFSSSTYEDEIPVNSGWSTGDFNGDGEFTSDDLVLAFQRGTYKHRNT